MTRPIAATGSQVTSDPAPAPAASSLRDAMTSGDAVSIELRNVTKRYPGARHEIFNETNREEVLDDALAFVHEHIG